jgi:hypothetical protein
VQNCNRGLYRVFDAIDQKIFVRGAKALEQINVADLLPHVRVLEIKPITGRRAQHFSEADVEQIQSYELDILVMFGSGVLQGDILLAAKHGVWAYRWGDQRKIANGLTGFWEVARGWPETGAALIRLGSASRPQETLFESWFFTYPYSPARSRNHILWAAASFLPRQIERLYRLGERKFFQHLRQPDVEEVQSPLKPNDVPSGLTVLWIAGKLAGRNLLERARRILSREQWQLLIHFGDHTETDLSSFKKIIPPKDRFWADPHVLYQEPNYYIFVEEFPYRTQKGHLSVIEMDKEGKYKQPIPILQENCHLSYPFVFEWRGHYYMVPESSGKRTIDLYECIGFPDRWQHKLTLMKDIRAVDTTLIYFQGKWWLFTAMAEQEAAAPQVELFLFYSEELFTDRWHAHPLNPIVSDVKKARAAGRIFEKNERLFRPSQYCSSTYGYGFDLNEIIVLSETEYLEKTVSAIRPDRAQKIIATHTYANRENLTVVDALTRRFKWANTT